VRDLSSQKEFTEILKVNDFRVAISYGKESIAELFMRDGTGLIMFGADTWKVLTGDEFNAFRLFLWQLRYLITELDSKWDRSTVHECLSETLDSFYDDKIDEKLSQIVKMKEFIELENILN
jgi:hypothetical protein